MILRIISILVLLYFQKHHYNCICMTSLFRRLPFLTPSRKMTTDASNPLVGTKLSTEALNQTLLTHKDETTSLKKLLSELPPNYKGLVLFLFPSAGTPGCTKQACNFRTNHQAFKERGYEVYGLTSREHMAASKWTEKHELTFTTLVDKEMKLVDHLDCRKLLITVNRSHLVLSRDGKVLAFEKGVKAETSAERVLELLEGFK